MRHVRDVLTRLSRTAAVITSEQQKKRKKRKTNGKKRRNEQTILLDPTGDILRYPRLQLERWRCAPHLL